MKNYKIFKHQDGRIEAVKQGWSWPGFFFGIIWALIKKLWGLVGILVVVMVVFGVVDFTMAPNPNDYNDYYQLQEAISSYNMWSMASNVISIIIAIIIGIKGNDLREKNLLSKGYVLINTIFAANPDMAILELKKTEQDNNNDNTTNSIINNNNSSNIVI